MIGLDTNVLVRYIVRDDEADARAATRLIEGECSADDPGLVGIVVLCEIAWVLDRGYGYGRSQVADVIRGILSAQELDVENRDLAWMALRQFEAQKADFADYVIALVARHGGASTTMTFDRRAADGDLFTSLRTRG